MAGAMLLLLDGTSRRYGFGSEAALRRLAERLGMWAIPAYVVAHAVALAVCLPNAVFFEVSASLLYGFLTAVLSVVSAKVLGASLSSCWIGRAIFGSSKSATEWAHSSRYFHLLARGVERDGWRFVLLAWFSPLPSYVINYSTSLSSLAGAAVASTTGSRKSSSIHMFFPYLELFPVFSYL
ncbi:hypothetical protein OPV22_019721 [Ensete ventricosum]|uniref:VTT domain-containing protein n=1 Tax=Ensete ventricosum TaxID=4639 RepID=A0AAV8QHM2_ENSVE|nr:hypothetical protein OPV22_019721 [Ensete ventricosum]